ncbi:MAG: beta-lactamase family protein [Desulfobacteraceae bacterium]|nr:beta-lactamase family protein [Desulfobacteraceae bacterium]
MKIFRRLISVIILVLFLAVTALAQGLPQAKTAEEVGMSSERLARLTSGLQEAVDKGTIPGAVGIIVRKGKVAYFEAIGFQDRENKIAMTKDSIFRIYSMSKVFTSLAVMMLMEEGKIILADPVSKFLPELKDMKVGVKKINEYAGKDELVLVSANREMTIHDLLRHTSGLTYWFFGKPSLNKAQWKANNPFGYKQTLAEMVTKLSKVPLCYQPGTTWDYSQSTDVLGRIVEVVSGVSFDTFIAERIAKPLKLTDSGFWVEGADRQKRIAEPQINPATGKKPTVIDLTKRPNWLSGGGGMVSTASDYARLCQFFLNGGILDGLRLLSPKTIELMTSNHLPSDIKYAAVLQKQLGPMFPSPEVGNGFGLGFCVRTAPGLNPQPGSVGDYCWAGLFGTYFWVDPKEELVAVLMTQSKAQRNYYRSYMRDLVYQAIID